MPRRTSRFRGGRTHGRGMKAGRGAGKRGGKGNAGLHKHKFISVIKYDPKHFGRHGFKRPQTVVASPVTLNVMDLEEHIDTWVEQGRAKSTGKGSYEVDLAALGYHKLLGKGHVGSKFKLKVPQASEQAIAKVQEAGGNVETSGGKEEG